MRRAALALCLLFGVLLAAPHAVAAPSCNGCDPTVVVVNGDGTVTVSTTAAVKSGCVRHPNASTGECVLKVFNGTAEQATGIDPGNYRTGVKIVPGLQCPCTAQFWVHSGQWRPLSAMSAQFTP